jgi:hypothetical protein
MTIQEFHNNIDIELDKTLDFEYPYILPEQKDYWLNKAQSRIIKQRMYPKDPRLKGFEDTQKRIEDLRSLIKDSEELTPTTSGTKYLITLPNDYLYLVRHRCKTIDSICGLKTVKGVLAKQENLDSMFDDPFWKPIADEPLYYFLGNKLVYETEGNFTLSKAMLTYIKIPTQMRLGSQYSTVTTDIQCELTEQIHHEILDLTIAMLLENIESQRYQTNLNELTKIE